ncbi:MAG TPA: TolC family protein [Chitinophagaceae bacterium]|nr:TolC family protein [Chitinophagaceae bacterium]
MLSFSAAIAQRQKHLFLVLLAFITHISVINAQSNSVQTPDTNRINLQPLPDSIIEARLVELAIKSPLYEAAEHQNKVNEYQLKAAKNSWLNLLTISANYNDQTFAKQNPQNTYVYPKFFTGINIPLGTIFSRTAVKAAKEQVYISKANQEQLIRSIRADILGKYREYKITGALIRNQQQVVDDYKAGLMQAEQKFTEGQISIEEYNTASKNYNDEAAKHLNLQLEEYLLKLEIEKVIGVPLESIMY